MGGSLQGRRTPHPTPPLAKHWFCGTKRGCGYKWNAITAEWCEGCGIHWTRILSETRHPWVRQPGAAADGALVYKGGGKGLTFKHEPGDEQEPIEDDWGPDEDGVPLGAEQAAPVVDEQPQRPPAAKLYAAYDFLQRQLGPGDP